MTYYKSLTQDHKGPYSDFDFTPYLPKGKRPGKWLPKCIKLKICESGWHGCEDKQIIDYLNVEIYEVEIHGKIIQDNGKFSSEQMRLVRKCDGWNDKNIRLFACDCAEHILPIYEKDYPDDERLRNCIEISRKYANGEASRKELAAAWDAAMDAVWAAAMDAVWAAAWDAARDAACAAAMDAVWAAAWDAEQDWQWSKLKLILEANNA